MEKRKRREAENIKKSSGFYTKEVGYFHYLSAKVCLGL